MPIRPEQRAKYGDDWTAFSASIRFGRAQGGCECDGRCGADETHLSEEGRCTARHDDPLPGGWKVVLTVAHLTHDPAERDPDLVMAMCQRCHLSYDRDHHAETRAARRGDKDQPLLW